MIGRGYVIHIPEAGYIKRILQTEIPHIVECTGDVREAEVWQEEALARRVASNHRGTAMLVVTEPVDGKWIPTAEGQKPKKAPQPMRERKFPKQF